MVANQRNMFWLQGKLLLQRLSTSHKNLHRKTKLKLNKTNNVTLWIAKVDYEKAFNTRRYSQIIINQLRFADYATIIANSGQKLIEIIQEINKNHQKQDNKLP